VNLTFGLCRCRTCRHRTPRPREADLSTGGGSASHQQKAL